MSDVTRILDAIEQGDPRAAEQLLPLVYDELRRLAAQKLAQEKPRMESRIRELYSILTPYFSAAERQALANLEIRTPLTHGATALCITSTPKPKACCKRARRLSTMRPLADQSAIQGLRALANRCRGWGSRSLAESQRDEAE